jgi:cysteine sulfinate desulfinase/cysteine desulfurase-like protein
MGVDPALGRGALRLSLGPATTGAEVDRAVAAVAAAVERLAVLA